MSDKFVDFAEKLISRCKSYGATDAEVMIGQSADISVTCRNGKLEEIQRAESSGYGLRVFVGARSAIISSSKFDGADALAETAVSMAKIAPADEFTTLAPEKLLYKGNLELELYDDKEPEETTLIELAHKVEDTALAVKGVTNSEGGDASFASYTNTLVTSHGFAKSHNSSRCGISVRVLAGSGTEMQRDYDYSSARFMADLEAPEKIGKEAARRVLEKLNPRKVASGRFPVIFDPRVSRNLLSDLATGINGAAIGRGTSFLKNKLDEQLFPKAINIIDNPHIKRGLASKPFDGEGVKNEKLTIIENGVLKTWLLDVRSANQLKLVSNGRASRGSAGPSSPSSTNLYMENGQISVNELIKDIKSGFYVNETFGMGINYTNGDYSQGAGGFWIENGEITYAVSEVTLASNLLDMFKNIIPANDLEMKYAINSPTLLIDGMTLAGK